MGKYFLNEINGKRINNIYSFFKIVTSLLSLKTKKFCCIHLEEETRLDISPSPTSTSFRHIIIKLSHNIKRHLLLN